MASFTARWRPKSSLTPGGDDPERVAHDADEVELVDGARPSDEITEVGGSPTDEPGEQLGGVRRLPSTTSRQPGWCGEVVERHHRGDVPLAQCGADAAVVVKSGQREFPLCRFDPTPLEREAVGAEAHVRHQLDVLLPPEQRVTGVAARSVAARVRVVLPLPPVVVDVAAFDLMGRGRRAPEESVGEAELRCTGSMCAHGGSLYSPHRRVRGWRRWRVEDLRRRFPWPDDWPYPATASLRWGSTHPGRGKWQVYPLG